MKKGLILNHIWPSLFDALNQKDIAFIQCPFDLLEVWDENCSQFEFCLASISPEVDVDVNLSPTLQKNGMDLITTSQMQKKETLNYLKQRIYHLKQCGVNSISLSSPRFFDTINYDDALLKLKEMLCEIYDYCSLMSIDVLFETFDVSVDKKRILGNTEATYCFFEEIVPCADFGLIWDSAHFALERDNLLMSLSKLKRHIKRVHLANYSLDNNFCYFGDKHLPFGELGDMGIADVKGVVSFLKNNQFIKLKSVSVEVAKNEHLDSCKNAKNTVNHIKKIFDLF